MPRVKQFNEQEVLQNAMSLFWQGGYAATSIQDLVSHLGISRASLYDTYGGKESLFKKAFELYRQSNSNWIENYFYENKDVRKGLKNLFYQAIDQQDDKGCFVVNTTTEMLPGDSFIKNELEENKVKFTELFYSYLLKGFKNRQFSSKNDLKAKAELLFTFYNGLKVVTKLKHDPSNLKKSVDLIISSI